MRRVPHIQGTNGTVLLGMFSPAFTTDGLSRGVYVNPFASIVDLSFRKLCWQSDRSPIDLLKPVLHNPLQNLSRRIQ